MADREQGDADFDADELAMLRQLFRDEAHEALEQVTARALAAAQGALSSEAVTEMMRVTHTLKGSAGTVGLPGVVDLAHRFESALAFLRAGKIAWSSAVADQIVEIADSLRAHVDGGDAASSDRCKALIDALGRGVTAAPAQAIVLRWQSAPAHTK